MANYHDKERINIKTNLMKDNNLKVTITEDNELSYGKRQSSYWWVGITCFLRHG